MTAMTIVIGASKLRVKCNHAGCSSDVSVKVTKGDVADARAMASGHGWAIRPDGDYCPDRVSDIPARKRPPAS